MMLRFSCTESKEGSALNHKIEEIQVYGLKLTATLIERFSATEMPQLYCIYEALIGKLQYTLQISSYSTQDHVLQCLDVLFHRMHRLKGTLEKPMPGRT